MNIASESTLPGNGLLASRMPGHWLLARLGKQVLRPGGLALTHRLIEALSVCASDRIVEFAPGLGVTAKRVLKFNPASYTAIEEDEAAAARVRRLLSRPSQRCLVGTAEDTGLPGNSATIVYGEAMLSMQGPEQKRQIVREARRVLRTGGRYGIHELCLIPDNLNDGIKREVQRALSGSIHVGVRPLTAAEWRELFEAEGFEIRAEILRPMRLLEPDRLIQDEGFWGALKFGWNLLRDQAARERVLEMRRVFAENQSHLTAIVLVAEKRGTWEF